MKINLDEELREVLDELGGAFARSGEELHLVGGAVRDLVLGLPHGDLDFTTTANPGKIRRIANTLAEAVYDKSRAKGHGTQGVKLRRGIEVEITPFRRCAASTAPACSSGKPTLVEDLAARDFTINAIALQVSPSISKEPFDPHGGLADLSAGALRTPLPPMTSLDDDPLRMLRAARFAAGFSLTPDPELVTSIQWVLRDTAWTDRIAPERVREEMLKMLMQQCPSAGIGLMHDWGLLGVWLPELAELFDLQPEIGEHHKDLRIHTLAMLDRASELGPPSPVFRFAALMHDSGKTVTRELGPEGYTFRDHEKAGGVIAESVCERLRFSNDDSEQIRDLVANHSRICAYTSDWTDSAVRRAVNELGARLEEFAVLARADITTSDSEKMSVRLAAIDEFMERASRMELEHVMNPRPPIDGAEIMSILGIGPGRDVGLAISHLKQLVVDGSLDPTDTESARRIVLQREWEKQA